MKVKRHDYTIGTLDVLQACDACADMGMTYPVIVQCTDCVVFPVKKWTVCNRNLFGCFFVVYCKVCNGVSLLHILGLGCSKPFV